MDFFSTTNRKIKKQKFLIHIYNIIFHIIQIHRPWIAINRNVLKLFKWKVIKLHNKQPAVKLTIPIWDNAVSHGEPLLGRCDCLHAWAPAHEREGNQTAICSIQQTDIMAFLSQNSTIEERRGFSNFLVYETHYQRNCCSIFVEFHNKKATISSRTLSCKLEWTACLSHLFFRGHQLMRKITQDTRIVSSNVSLYYPNSVH